VVDGANNRLLYLKRQSGVWQSPQVAANENPSVVSLALNSAGIPSIAYGTAGETKYAQYNGAWSTTTVDAFGSLSGISLAIDGADLPHIAYAPGAASISYASFDGTSWNIMTGIGAGGAYPSLALDGAGNPQIAYISSNDSKLHLAKFNGGWSYTTIEADGAIPVSIALDASANAYIIHQDSSQNLRLVKFNGAGYSISTVDPAAYPFPASIALDGAGNPVIVYEDNVNSGSVLIFARFTGTQWSTGTVDTYGSGASASVAIDQFGDPHIAYNAANGDLRAAHWVGAGLPAPMGGNAYGKVQEPTNFHAATVESGQITWSWTDNSSDELGFRLYGAATSTGPFTLIADTTAIAAAQASYLETGLTGNTAYFRYIAAVSTGGVVTSSGATVLTPVASGPLYWIRNTAGYWNDKANWSTASGGTGGAGVPGAANDALFDAKGTGNCTIDIDVAVDSITISSSTSVGYPGVIDAGTHTITMAGDFTLDYGTFTANTSSLTVVNNFTRLGGVFNAGASSMTLAGAPASLSTLTGSTTFFNLIVTQPGKIVDFAAGSTTTVSGILNLAGASGNLIQVRSTTPTQYAFLVNSGTNTVTFVDAEDNNAGGGAAIAAGGTSHDSGHNVNWTFGSPAATPRITQVYVSSLTVTWGTIVESEGYSVDASTASDFTGSIVSSMTLDALRSTMTFNFGTLNPDTTYFVRVGAFFSGGTTTYALTVPPSTSTLTNLINPSVLSVSSQSVTVGWPAFTVGSGTDTAQGYELDVSTSQNFITLQGSSITYTAAVSTLTIAGLQVATTYYVRAGAINWNNVVNYAAIGSTMTSSGPAPTNVQITAVYVSSITATWSAESGANGYSLEASTAAWPNSYVGNVSSVTFDASRSTLTFNLGQLAANTTYFVRVGSLWNGATSYPLTPLPSTSTLTTPITTEQYYQVNMTSVAVSWAAFGIGPGNNTSEGYELDASTAGDFTGQLFMSSNTAPAVSTLTLTGLTPSTTYFFRVGGINYNDVVNFTVMSATQTLGVPTPMGLAGNAIGVSSISWAWGAFSNIPGISYILYQATSPTTQVYSGTANSFTEPNLSTNTAYGRVVSAMLSGVQSPLSAAVTTYTDAAVPGQPVPSSVSYTSFTVTWSTNTNPDTTPFEVSYSTANDFSGVVSTPVAFPPPSSFTSNTTDFVGLTPGTTYYVRVRAENGNWIPTAFSTYGSTTTRPVPVPTGLSATVLGTSSITWTWGLVTGATSYNIYVASSPASPVASTTTLSWLETGLSTNTSYGLMVTAVVNAVESAKSPAVSTFTFAAAPGPLTFSGVASNQFTVTWLTNGNPGTTPYEVSLSTDGFVMNLSTPIQITDDFTSNTTTFVGLQPLTTYYVRVRAQNGSLIFSTFSVVNSTETLAPLPNNPAAVTDLTAAANGLPGGAILTWTAPGEQGEVGTITSGEFFIAYTTDVAFAQSTVTWSTAAAQVMISTWNVAPGTLESATLSLKGGATYYFRIWTQNTAGFWSDLSNGATAQTFVFSPDTFTPFVLGTTSITWNWTDSRNLYVDGYNLLNSTGGWVATVGGGTFSATETALSTNTAYTREVQAFTGSSSSTTFSLTRYTFAAPPVASTCSAVTTESVALTWGADGNPAGTLYYAEVSAQPTFGTATSSTTVLTTATVANLLSNVTYYAHVRAQNGDGAATGFDVTLTTVTPAAIPVNGLFTTVSGSTITVSWGGSTNANGTLYQAELSTISLVGASTQTIVGSALNATFTGLIPNTTYYARVKALGWTGEDSAYLYIGQIETSLEAPTNVRFLDVEISTITAGWDPIAESNVQYVAQLHDSGPTDWISSTTLGTTASFSGLAVNAQYFFRVFSQDPVTLALSASSVVISTYTLANPPVSLSTTSVTSSSIGLAWMDGGNPSVTTSYSVERSTDGVTFTSLAAPQIGLSYTDLIVSEGTTYKYRVRALNGNGVPSAPSNVVTVTTLGVIVAPKVPSGFWAEGQGIGSAFSVTYHWQEVTERVDGSPLNNLAGYPIYGSNNILAPTSEWVLVTTATTNAWSMTPGPGSFTYYAVRAVDAGGLVSGCSHAIDDSAGLVHYFIAPDGVTRAEVPQTAANVLRQTYNSFASNLTLQWVEVPADETGRVVRSMMLKAVSDATGEAVANFAFSDPALVGIITFGVANGQIVAGAPQYNWLGTANSPAIPAQNTYAPAGSGLMPASQAAGDLSLFWYDGAEWVKTTGQVDTTNNAVSFTGRQVGYFQIRVASHAPTPSQISLTKVYPRIITPNGDGWNDKAIFQFDNPQLLPLSGQIFDVTGAKVASLSAGPNPDSTLQWDGKDSAGRIVPAGVYLYEVDISGSSPVTGTVVVAR